MKFSNTIKIPAIGDVRYDELYIYEGDEYGEDLEVGKYLKVESKLSTEEKIEIIVEELQERFSDIEIEIKGYRNVVNKKVLILDLKDRERPVGSYLNAGSTGSRINLGIIVNSVLQNEKNIDNWIDGLKIMVNGEENIEGEHITLAEIFYKSADGTIDLQ